MSKNSPIKKYPTVACCGLDCGLCPAYYIEGPSKCPGCCGPDFSNKHPSCSIITCCVKKHDFETCAECDEFPCPKIDKWDKYDSFISHQVSLSNLELIRENGLDQFVSQQKRRIELLHTMLEEFNDGRSKSFYCIATALLPVNDLKNALQGSKQEIKDQKIDGNNLKAKSKILKSNLSKFANSKYIDLKLKKK